jgi:hypothetical protein
MEVMVKNGEELRIRWWILVVRMDGDGGFVVPVSWVNTGAPG